MYIITNVTWISIGKSVIVCMLWTTVVLSGSSSNADFRGFLIQGRTMTNTVTGTFVDNGDDQKTICNNVSALVYMYLLCKQEFTDLVYSI